MNLPGSSKTLFAFAELPTIPRYYDNEPVLTGDAPFDKGQWARHDVAKKWDTMTWVERCEWEWYGSSKWLYEKYLEVEAGYYDHPVDIVLMASPKFELDVGSDAQDVATALLKNVGGVHKYVNGNGNDLTEVAYEAENGNIRRRAHDWGLSYKDSRVDQEFLHNQRCQYRVKWETGLVFEKRAT